MVHVVITLPIAIQTTCKIAAHIWHRNFDGHARLLVAYSLYYTSDHNLVSATNLVYPARWKVESCVTPRLSRCVRNDSGGLLSVFFNRCHPPSHDSGSNLSRKVFLIRGEKKSSVFRHSRVGWDRVAVAQVAVRA